MRGIMKKVAEVVRTAAGKKAVASAEAGDAKRKDNMAGMAIEAKKGGSITKSKMKDKMGRAVKRKTADVKGRAMKGK